MQALMLMLALTADPAAVVPTATETYATPESAAVALDERLPTGTMLFSQGDCLAVRVVSRSKYTHVAVVVRDAGGEEWVYDSQNGVGVRKSPLPAYLSLVQPDEVTIITPARPMDDASTEQLTAALEAQLGRPYHVAHFVTGKRNEGLHCAEYATDALSAAGVVSVECPPRVSPASLRSGLLRYDLYEPGPAVLVIVPTPERAPGKNWCHEAWLDTKDCWHATTSVFSRCVICR